MAVTPQVGTTVGAVPGTGIKRTTPLTIAALNEIRASGLPQDFGDRGGLLPDYVGDDLAHTNKAGGR
jgi:hypothetical protein